ncbi:MAG: SRPBCC domain-containing protein [Planctomycetota bacterium]
MTTAKTLDISVGQYELSIDIDAPRDRVWRALLEETGSWWLPTYHMVGAGSQIEFDISPGGRGLIEHRADGSFLQWYTVQFFQPTEFKLFLVGNIAPEYGGPSTSNLCISLIEREGGTTLNVSDTHLGRVDERFLQSLEGGWKEIFGDGLRQHVESA